METIKSAIASTVQTVVGDSKSKELSQCTTHDQKEGNIITTNYGVKQSDTDNTLKAGARGPSLLEDFHFREKITHFDHEVANQNILAHSCREFLRE